MVTHLDQTFALGEVKLSMQRATFAPKVPNVLPSPPPVVAIHLSHSPPALGGSPAGHESLGAVKNNLKWLRM